MDNQELDDLVTRLYRAAMSIADPGWQELLKNAAFSLSGARDQSSILSALALTDTVLVLAETGKHLGHAVCRALRQNLRSTLTPTLSRRERETSVEQRVDELLRVEGP